VRVIIDKDACVGHGRCHAEAPELFDLDEMGCCEQDEIDVPPELESGAQRGAGSCPERAIAVVIGEPPATGA
jgi:ferredoxin